MSATAGLAAWAVLAGSVLAACGGSGGSAGPVRVVAAENFWGDIAAQLGGSRVSVRSIISDPNADPHLYESDAADAAAVARARLVIENGAGYDDFMARLLGTGGGPGRQVLLVQKVIGATGRDVNPHYWYDTAHIPRIAAAIEAALARADPTHRSDYQKNLARFDTSLAPIEADIASIRARFQGVPVAYTERVPGYLLADCGLRLASPPGFAAAIEDGNEPSPADSQAMDALISGRHVRVLLYNTQTVSAVTRHVRAVAGAAGVPVVGVTETLPNGAGSYQEWQLRQVSSLLAALGGSR